MGTGKRSAASRGGEEKKRNHPTFRKRQQRRRQRPAGCTTPARRHRAARSAQRKEPSARRGLPDLPPRTAPHSLSVTRHSPRTCSGRTVSSSSSSDSVHGAPLRGAASADPRRPRKRLRAPPLPGGGFLSGPAAARALEPLIAPPPPPRWPPPPAVAMGAGAAPRGSEGAGVAERRRRGRTRGGPRAPAPRTERPPRHSHNRTPFICLPRAAGRSRRAVDFRTSPPPDAVGKCKNKAATAFQK